MLNPEKLCYTVAEFVAATGIARTQLFAHLKTGRLKAHKSGRRVVILAADAQAFLDSLPVRETPDPPVASGAPASSRRASGQEGL